MNATFQRAPSDRALIADLLPTQMTVGRREVGVKRTRWRNEGLGNAARCLDMRRVPVVVGPGKRYYMIDRHHLTMALSEEGVAEVPISVVENIGELGFEEFWETLEHRSWTHPFDDAGCRCPFERMPTSITALMDDPFRSLAGALKRAGGYAKSKAPFSEFRWADFLRMRIDRRLVECDFERALAAAMTVARSSEAAGLPGWSRLQH